MTRQNQVQQIGQRISVVGTTGLGKTTIARKISEFLELPHIELDELYWDKNWTGVSDEIFQDRVKAGIRNEQWVIDGNYSRVRNLVWARANSVVYLDYAYRRVFWQLMTRTIRRSLRKNELWNGNREDFRKSFFSRDSIMLWMLRTYYRRRKQYSELFQQPVYAHLYVVHLRTPRMTKEWLSSISTTEKSE